MRRLAWAQVIITLISAAAFFMATGTDAVTAAIYGGVLAMFNTLVLARAVFRAGRAALRSPGTAMAQLYMAGFMRWIFLIVALAVAISWLDLLIVPLMITFGVVSLGIVFQASQQRQNIG